MPVMDAWAAWLHVGPRQIAATAPRWGPALRIKPAMPATREGGIWTPARPMQGPCERGSIFLVVDAESWETMLVNIIPSRITIGRRDAASGRWLDARGQGRCLTEALYM